MAAFRHTDAAADFIATAASRETSRELMETIAFFAQDAAEAERIWDGDFGNAVTLLDIWENVTSNGLRDASDYCWGAEGSAWANDLLDSGKLPA